MSAKSNADAVVQNETAAEANVPHQGGPKLEVVEGIVVDERPFKEKLKDAFKNKKITAGASAVVLIAVGVLVAKKRLETGEVEDTTTES